MRRLLAVFVAFSLLCTGALGCAALPGIITQVASVIAEITGVVDLIDSQAQTASESGLLPAEVAKRITAVRAAVARINDAARQGPAAYAAAVAEFERLYADLVRVVEPLGVRARPLDGRLSAAAPGTVQVPPAGELGARLRAVQR
jgi:hypothetical protein